MILMLYIFLQGTWYQCYIYFFKVHDISAIYISSRHMISMLYIFCYSAFSYYVKKCLFQDIAKEKRILMSPLLFRVRTAIY